MIKSFVCGECPYNEKINYVDKNNNIDIVYKNSEKLDSVQSKYQKIEVYKNKFFGTILTIDGDIQLTEHDESNYHEMIAHVPLNYIPDAKKILIIGGGDGGTAREVAKHKNLEEIIMVDIDEEVIKMSKKYFPKLAEGFEDKRVNVVIDDGAKWVKKNLKDKKNYFDVILIDSTDYNTAQTLFTDDFYSNLKNILKKNGILVFNCLSISWEKKEIDNVIDDMSEFFKYVRLYQLFQPTYASGHYAFCFCSRTIDPKNTPVDFDSFNKKKIDCVYYNNNIHYDSFNLPNEFFGKEKSRVGTSFLITIKDAPFSLLNSRSIIKDMINFIVKIYQFKPLNITNKKKTPNGFDFLVLLENGYLAINTWPEKKMATIDLMNYKNFVYDINLNSKKINFKTIIKFYLKPSKMKIKSIEREI